MSSLLVAFILLLSQCTPVSDGNNNQTNTEHASSDSQIQTSANKFANESGYDIEIKFKNVRNSACYLGHHFGEKQYVKDTVQIDANGIAKFKSDNSDILGGIYLVILEDKKYFEFILNERKFKIETDSSDFLNKTKFKGSKENQLFYDDLRFIDKQRKKAERMSRRVKALGEKSDSGKIYKQQLDIVDKEVKKYRKDIIDNNQGYFYPKLIAASQDPTVPDPPVRADGSIDSSFQYRYYKAHYFDGIDFTEPNLLNTPVFHRKLDYYFSKLTVQHPDSVLKEAYEIIDNRINEQPDVFKYVVNYITSTYEKSKVMGMDAVFVGMVNKYYRDGRTYWIDDTQMYKIKDRARKLDPLLLGKKAPNMILKDRDGKVHSMYEIEAEATIIYLWDPDCGHCKKQTPILKKFWDKYKNESVQIYAACTEVEKDKWLNYIDENKLDWINVADFDFRSPFREQYDIYSTPVIYLLDKDKRIKVKKIGAEQLEQVYLDYKAGKIKW